MLIIHTPRTDSTGSLILRIPWNEIKNGTCVSSQPTSISGLQWSFDAQYNSLKGSVQIDLHCLSVEANEYLLYWIQIKKTLKYFEKDQSVTTSWCGSYSYNNSFGFLTVTNAKDVVGPDGCLELDITTKIGRMMYYDLSKYHPASSDTLLKLNNIEGEESIYVSKSALSMQSEFFNTFFNSQHYVEGQNEVYELTQVDLKALIVVLYDVYGLPVDFKNPGMDTSLIKDAIELADRFQLTMTLVRFEKALLALDKSTRNEWLEFADKHGMDTFVYEAVSSLSVKELILLSVGGLSRFRYETAQMIFNKMTIY